MSKKGKILEAALKLFASHGVDRTTTAQITKAVGVAEGTLFVHFKNKQALVDAVYVDIKQREAEALKDVITDNRGVEENIRALTKAMAEYFLARYDELVFIVHVQQHQLVSEKAVADSSKHLVRFTEHLKQWQQEGAIKTVDWPLLGEMMWGMMVALIRYCQEHEKQVSKRMVDPIWDAIRA